MKSTIVLAVLVLLAIIGLFSSTYVVSEPEQVFITRLGKIPGVPEEPVKKDGNQTEAEKEEFQRLQRLFEEAVKNAVTEAGRTVKNIKSVYVKDMNGKVQDNKIVSYGVTAKISFLVND